MSQPPSFLDRAGAWFLNSGIQEPSGGVARYYRSDTGKNARVSTEITGYAVSALAYLHRRTGKAEYLDAAARAARFLIRCAWDGGLSVYPFEYPGNGDAPCRYAYFFDCGIIARGLLAVWRASGEALYLDAAVECGLSMARDFGGELHPILELPSKQPLAHEPRWSRSPGCYQLKSAMAWRDLADVTGEAEFARRYEQALEAALANHEAFLPGEQDREKVMDRLHAYCYFLEGLLAGVERPECAAAMAAGLDRVAGLLREIGPRFERSDVAAQLLRARLYAEACGAAPLDEAAGAEEAARAASFQFSDADRRIGDGFGFGRKGAQMMPFVNPVSTAFCLQALDMWELRRQGRFAADRGLLI